MPARDLIDWDNDEEFKTDMSRLEDQFIKKKEYRVNHQIFNTPNYQVLDRETKMEMLWE